MTITTMMMMTMMMNDTKFAKFSDVPIISA